MVGKEEIVPQWEVEFSLITHTPTLAQMLLIGDTELLFHTQPVDLTCLGDIQLPTDIARNKSDSLSVPPPLHRSTAFAPRKVYGL